MAVTLLFVGLMVLNTDLGAYQCGYSIWWQQQKWINIMVAIERIIVIFKSSDAQGMVVAMTISVLQLIYSFLIMEVTQEVMDQGGNGFFFPFFFFRLVFFSTLKLYFMYELSAQHTALQVLSEQQNSNQQSFEIRIWLFWYSLL